MKHLSKVIVICLLLVLSGCAREAGKEDGNESILESEVTMASLGEGTSEIDTEVETDESLIEDMLTEVVASENDAGNAKEIDLEHFQIDSGMLNITDIVEGYEEAEEYHQMYAKFMVDKEVVRSIYLGSFYYYPEYESMMVDYKFLVTVLNEKKYFLYQVMSGIEGPGVDYYLFEIRENDLVEERSILDPGYSDGRQLFDTTGIDKNNYYSEGVQLTDLADKNYEKILGDIFSPYNISGDDLLIRPEWD